MAHSKGKSLLVIQRGSVKLPIYRREQRKGDKTYISHYFPDYSSGQRKVWTFAELEDAKAKAAEIADAMAAGKLEMIRWSDVQCLEIRNAIEAVKPTGVGILPACRMFAEAVEVLGGPEQLLFACRAWMKGRRDKPFKPKLVTEAAKEFMSKQARLSPYRRSHLQSYMNSFAGYFKCHLHEISSAQISDFVNEKGWAPKTICDALGSFSLLYKEGQLRGWVPDEHNPVTKIKRPKLKGGSIGIFTPAETRQMLHGIEDDLKPLLALWCFAGIRAAEISRLSWEQVNAGVESGSIYLRADQAKTGQARAIWVSDNLKAWLGRYGLESGPVVPLKRQRMSWLSDIGKRVKCQSGVVWQRNAPRHTFGTFHAKLFKDPMLTVDTMGTSLVKFERHYRNRSSTVTEAAANEFFGIMPPVAQNADQAANVQLGELPIEETHVAQPTQRRSESHRAQENVIAVEFQKQQDQLDSPDTETGK